jgi:Glycosyl hydrolase family 85
MSGLKEAGLIVVWYDSPLSGGYANRLTNDAYPFFDAAGYFQANYDWGPAFSGTDDYPEKSWEILQQHLGENQALQKRNNVCMMMDCWPTRSTPPYSGKFFPALARVNAPAPLNYYTALGCFVPDWVLYWNVPPPPSGMSQNSVKLPSTREVFRDNDQAFWAGTKDFVDYPNPGDRIVPKRSQCIADYVEERSVITATPFVTWFNGGEGDFYNIRGERQSTGPWNNLSDQSLLPTWRFRLIGAAIDAKANDSAIDYGDAFTGGSSLRLSCKGFDPANPLTVWLYKTHIKLTATNTLLLTVKEQNVEITPLIGLLGLPSLELTSPQMVPITNGWKQLTYPMREGLAGEIMTGIGVILKQANPEGEIRLGELSFLDTVQAIEKPWTKSFPAADLLDWSNSFQPSSHYRIYGLLNQTYYLIGIVYNSEYITVRNVFNSDKKGFTCYVVQEVNAAGDSTPIC